MAQFAQLGVPADQFPGGGVGREFRWRRRFPHGSNELVSPLRECFDEPRIFGTVAERAPNIEDVGLQHLRLDESIRPQSVEKFILGNQPAGVLYQITQDGERLRRYPDTLFIPGICTPQTLVRGVQAERRKLLHAYPALLSSSLFYPRMIQTGGGLITPKP